MRALTEAIEARRIQLLVHEYALAELRRVLSYPQCKLAAPEQQRAFDRYRSLASIEPMPEGFSRDSLLLPPGFPRCRDSDDQPFLALAYHARADALVTQDKAILKLRKKARKFGVQIVPSLGAWSIAASSSGESPRA